MFLFSLFWTFISFHWLISPFIDYVPLVFLFLFYFSHTGENVITRCILYFYLRRKGLKLVTFGLILFFFQSIVSLFYLFTRYMVLFAVKVSPFNNKYCLIWFICARSNVYECWVLYKCIRNNKDNCLVAHHAHECAVYLLRSLIAVTAYGHGHYAAYRYTSLFFKGKNLLQKSNYI